MPESENERKTFIKHSYPLLRWSSSSWLYSLYQRTHRYIEDNDMNIDTDEMRMKKAERVQRTSRKYATKFIYIHMETVENEAHLYTFCHTHFTLMVVLHTVVFIDIAIAFVILLSSMFVVIVFSSLYSFWSTSSLTPAHTHTHHSIRPHLLVWCGVQIWSEWNGV